MLAGRVLRISAGQVLKNYFANPMARRTLQSSWNHNHRALCVPQPVQNQPPGPAATSTSKTKPSNEDTSIDNGPLKSSAVTRDTKPSEKPSPATETTTEQKEKIPDIPSISWSSIGFEEKDAKDPNKWKKFAWKYAGAVLLFMISYKTLHWYTDRLEADGKRRRKEMEEDREIAEQILSSEPSTAQKFPFLEPLKDAPQLPQTTSELDELYIYKGELQQRLKDLGSQGRSSEVREQTKETQAELKDLSEEIKQLEAKKAGS